MTIQAISSVKNNGYVNNISFGGKKDKPVQNPNMTTPLKAVPLAVLIALSPMTTTRADQIMSRSENVIELAQTQDDNAKVITAKEFILGNNKTGTVALMEDNEGKQGLYFVYQDKSKNTAEAMTIDSYNVINADIVSSNGVVERSISFPLVNMTSLSANAANDLLLEKMANSNNNSLILLERTDRTITNKEIVKYIDDLNVKYKEDHGKFLIPGTLKKVQYSPDTRGAGLNLREPLFKMTDVGRDLGTKVKTIAKDFEGSHDTYTVNLRKLKDGRDIISVSGENMPELMLTGHSNVVVFLESDFDNIAVFGMSQMNFDYFCPLLDEKLGAFLKQLSQSSEYLKYFPEYKDEIVNVRMCTGGYDEGPDY